MDSFTLQAGVFSGVFGGHLRMRIITVRNGRCGIFPRMWHDVCGGDGLSQLWHSLMKHAEQLLLACYRTPCPGDRMSLNLLKDLAFWPRLVLTYVWRGTGNERRSQTRTPARNLSLYSHHNLPL